MKRVFCLVMFVWVGLVQAKEVNSDQIKVAYTYNFLKHTIWKNEGSFKEYHLLIVSENESLKNLFMMLSSRKLLDNKKIRLSFYDPRSIPKNIQAIYVDEASGALYEKLFERYESEDVLFISDGYKDRRKVMINLLENTNIITFEINKANILNRSLNISPDLVLLGGSEIDVAKLYKSSQDELKEQKEAIRTLNQQISEKNRELSSKIASIEKQKSAIELQNTTISDQFKSITEQSQTIRQQQTELEVIRQNIELQKKQLADDEQKIREKEIILKGLLESHQQKHQEINKAKEELDALNERIANQKENLNHQEGVIDSQQSAIGGLLFLSVLIIALSVLVFKQNRRLNELSRVDPLTGLFNRRAFSSQIEHELDQFERYGTPFFILLMDIDHFKTINDTLGHESGDKVLRGIGDLMQKHLRKTDFCVRWGGEEFLVMAKVANDDNVLIMAENLRSVIEKHDFGIGKKVTVSIGVSHAHVGENEDKVIGRADDALYEAKNSGRNRVVIKPL